MALNSTQTIRISSRFFDIVNNVLTDAGREPLPRSSSDRSIIIVRDSDRVLQILAGPGAGKTEMLTWRVLYELFVNGISPSQLLVTTFTRRAATEMQVRLVERCDAFIDQARKMRIGVNDPHVHDVRIGTIHSLCDSLLAEFSDDYVADGIQLIDDFETSVRLARSYRYVLGYQTQAGNPQLVERLLNHEALVALFRPPWGQDVWPVNNMERVEFIKILIAQHIETWESRCAGSPRRDNGIQNVHNIANLTDDLIELERRWREGHLNRNHLADFTTIQKLFISYQNDLLSHFRHIFVDEFQDTNPIQFMIHTGWTRNPLIRLTVVGDDDQAIYRFRGSDIGCFQGLEPFCKKNRIPHRLERLEVNHRSTKCVVAFTQAFRENTVLSSLSMPKNIQAKTNAPTGPAVRLLEGTWQELAEAVAIELEQLGVGRVPTAGQHILPSAAVLIFSTSERSSKSHGAAPALALRQAIERRSIRVYNPRSKTAAQADSPVGMLLGLLSYLIDPVTVKPVGKNGRPIMVWASSDDKNKSRVALSRSPTYLINQKHINFQKKFRKAGGSDIRKTPADRQTLLNILDEIRANLAKPNKKRQPRLTLSGLVYRLIAQEFFRNSGFTVQMFRQALFTQLMEANIAPTRLTRNSLDQPLEVSRRGSKYVWPSRLWYFLGHFGALLDHARIDDLEIESFEDNAVLLITFHQAKGLEFDHIYIAGMGRNPDITPVLRTKLFSGEHPSYQVVNGVAVTRSKKIRQLSKADREREVYVAMTRAKKSLTLLHDPSINFSYMNENRVITQLFSGQSVTSHRDVSSVNVKEWTNG